jgi:hypothetical protein
LSEQKVKTAFRIRLVFSRRAVRTSCALVRMGLELVGVGRYLHASVYLCGPRIPVCLAVGAALSIRSDGRNRSGGVGFEPICALDSIIIGAPETSMFCCGRFDKYSVSGNSGSGWGHRGNSDWLASGGMLELRASTTANFWNFLAWILWRREFELNCCLEYRFPASYW